MKRGLITIVLLIFCLGCIYEYTKEPEPELKSEKCDKDTNEVMLVGAEELKTNLDEQLAYLEEQKRIEEEEAAAAAAQAQVQAQAQKAPSKSTSSGYSSGSSYNTPSGNNVLTKAGGVNYYNGRRETWYSQRVLPGGGLNIPGRHVAEDGTVRDGDGYICVAASDLAYGTVVDTSLGAGKVYDSGCDPNTTDVYVAW